jgi:NADPH-dependent curcumin reductase CurA
MTAPPLIGTPSASREWHLVSHPEGWPSTANFALREAAIPEVAPGQVLVRNVFLSVDPYMRGRMDAAGTSNPYSLDTPLDGRAVGVVVASQADGFAVGDHVRHMLGWREYAVLDARTLTRVDPFAAPLPAYLGVLGNAGLTAYAGLLRVAALRTGDVVFVSGAAGAVGSLTGQIAKLLGASKVIGSAGSAGKVRLLREEYGFDAAFSYRDGPVGEQLASAAPEGIDVYFDNVGGDHLEAALDRLKPHGRVVMCGMISQYNATEPHAAPRNLMVAVLKSLRLEGIQVADHADLEEQFVQRMSTWIREGSVYSRQTLVEGLENAVDAFLGMLRGENVGKMIVSLGEC